MKVTIPTTKEVDIKYITMELAVRYEEEDMPNDAPLREGDLWKASVAVDSGQIQNWPKGKELEFYMKVCDEGTYRLFDADWNEQAAIVNGYVPNSIIPGEYGDYVRLSIDADGVITNWPARPSFEDFWPDGDCYEG